MLILYFGIGTSDIMATDGFETLGVGSHDRWNDSDLSFLVSFPPRDCPSELSRDAF